MKKSYIIGIIVAVIVIIGISLGSGYNKMVKENENVESAAAQIDVQLKRRTDLIPNLVNTVKGYMTHESDTLAKVTELRTAWAGAKTVDEKAKLDNELSNTLKTIMAVAEAYPDLKANQNFESLQNELTETEDKISYSRQFYNDTVTRYNTKLELFPSNIIAGMFHFTAESLFEVDSAEARKNVKVDFNK